MGAGYRDGEIIPRGWRSYKPSGGHVHEGTDVQRLGHAVLAAGLETEPHPLAPRGIGHLRTNSLSSLFESKAATQLTYTVQTNQPRHDIA